MAASDELELGLFIEMNAKVSTALVESLESMLSGVQILDASIVASKTDIIARLRGRPDRLGTTVFDIMTGRIGQKPMAGYSPVFPTAVNPYLLTPVGIESSLPSAEPTGASYPLEAYVTIHLADAHPRRPQGGKEVRASPLERGIIEEGNFTYLARVENRQRLLGKLAAKGTAEMRQMLLDGIQKIDGVIATETFLVLPHDVARPKRKRPAAAESPKARTHYPVMFLLEVGAKDEGDFVASMKATISASTPTRIRNSPALPSVDLICGPTDAIAFVRGTNDRIGGLMVNLIQKPLDANPRIRLRALRTYLLDIVKPYTMSSDVREFEAYVEIELGSDGGCARLAKHLQDEHPGAVDFIAKVANRPHTVITRIGTKKKRSFDKLLLGDIQRHADVLTTRTHTILAEEKKGHADLYGEAQRRILVAFESDPDKTLTRREVLRRARQGYAGMDRSLESAIDRLVGQALMTKLRDPVRLMLTSAGKRRLAADSDARP